MAFFLSLFFFFPFVVVVCFALFTFLAAFEYGS